MLAEAYASLGIACGIAFYWVLLHEISSAALASLGGLILFPFLLALPFAASIPFRKRWGLGPGFATLVAFYLAVEWGISHGPLAFPWPLLGHTQATLRVERTQHVRAGLYDALGRRVAALYDGPAAAGAEVVLAGHDHHYERFGPMTPYGSSNPRGIRQFIVGTGGGELRREPETLHPLSERFIGDRHGVLKLTLEPGGYRWSFIDVEGRVLDSGRDRCR